MEMKNVQWNFAKFLFGEFAMGKCVLLTAISRWLKEKPQNCPKWLPVDVVDKNFWKRIQDKIKQVEEEKILCDRILPLGKSEYFEHILLPYCKKQSQAE